MPYMPLTSQTNQKTSKDRLPVCKFCNEPGHTKFYCRLRPRKPIPTRRGLKRIGKAGKRTATAVAKWKRTQQPNHAGRYTCYICGKEVDYLMAEHVKSKVRHPELRTDPNNLKSTCSECNERKKSNNG